MWPQTLEMLCRRLSAFLAINWAFFLITRFPLPSTSQDYNMSFLQKAWGYRNEFIFSPPVARDNSALLGTNEAHSDARQLRAMNHTKRAIKTAWTGFLFFPSTMLQPRPSTPKSDQFQNSLRSYKKYYITQYKELDSPLLGRLRWKTNPHHLPYTFL